MKENKIDIRDVAGKSIGSVTFEESPKQLDANRTAAGFDIHFPMTVNLKFSNMYVNSPLPMLSNISATVTAVRLGKENLILGRVLCPESFLGASPESFTPAKLTWGSSFAALCAYEQFRDGKRPGFKIALTAELCKLIPTGLTGTGIRNRSEPSIVQGEVLVSFPTEVWVQMIRGLGLSYPVFLEIPLSSSPPAPWNEVWNAVKEATESFEKGGETGWKGCISAVRLALDHWQKIEREEMGPGWNPHLAKEHKNRTKQQRLDNIRWHLREFCHLAPHGSAEQFTRDDALLMLSTLSALLQVRKP